MPSLLEKAKSIAEMSKTYSYTEEELDLALAVLRGEVSVKQATVAMGRDEESTSGTAYRLLNTLKFATITKKVKIELRSK